MRTDGFVTFKFCVIIVLDHFGLHLGPLGTVQLQTNDSPSMDCTDDAGREEHERVQLLQAILSRPCTQFLTDSMDTLFEKFVPQVVACYGSINTLIKGERFTLKLQDIVTRPSSLQPATRLFQCAMSRTVSVTGTLYLTRVRMEPGADGIPVPTGDEVLVCKEQVLVAKIPICTGTSRLFPTFVDPELPPGIFIIHGRARSLPLSKTAVNDTIILTRRKGVCTCQFRSSHVNKPFRSTSSIVFTVPTFCRRPQLVGSVLARLPFTKSDVHVVIVAIALGVTAEQFWNMVKVSAGAVYDETLFMPHEISVKYSNAANMTQDAASLTISKLFGKTSLGTAETVLKNETFPHLGTEFLPKAWLLAMCVADIIAFSHGLKPATQRDNIANTSLITPGFFCGQLFRVLFITHFRTVGKLLRRAIMTKNAVPLLSKVFGEPRLSTRIISAFASGTWTKIRKGITITLNTNNRMSVLGQLRRVSSLSSLSDGAHTACRQVPEDGFGFICPATTAEGEGVGLIGELAALTTLSPGPGNLAVMRALVADCLDPWLIPMHHAVSMNAGSDAVAPMFAFLNVGHRLDHVVLARHVDAVVSALLALRQSGGISQYLCIHLSRATSRISLSCVEGTMHRPLLRLCNGRRMGQGLSLTEQLQFVDMLSAMEIQSDHCRVAMQPQDNATHCEVVQSSFLGYLANMVPFATTVQGPRLSYFVHQARQVITADPSLQCGAAMTTMLWDSGRPIVRTLVDSVSHELQSLSGTPVVIAFIAMPDCQEDSILVNRSSVERGLMTASTVRNYTSDVCNPTPAVTERFEKLDHVLSRRNASYEYVEANGLPLVGTHIPGGNVVVSKTRSVAKTAASNTRQARQMLQTTDISTLSRIDEGGSVERVEVVTMPSGHRAKVSVRTKRVVSIGDKLTSRYSQKGVVSGLVHSADLPFSAVTGVAPDIIVSSIGIVSRLTMGSLLEALTGKTVAVSGDMSIGVDQQRYSEGYRQGTSVLGSIMAQHGYEAGGKEEFVDGKSGKMLSGRIFTGVASYFRLVHLSAKKIHSRSIGPRDPLTRQPSNGRARGGGLRTGELEVACLIAHGATAILKERFLELSDKFEIPICEVCHYMAEANTDLNYAYCRACANTTQVVMIDISYATLLLVSELNCLHISIKFETHRV